MREIPAILRRGFRHNRTVFACAMIRSYKFRLFTNANQERELAATLETHRRLYNRALDNRRLAWETLGVNWSYYEQSAWLTVQRRLNPFLARVNAKSAEQTLRKLDKAYRAFFKGGGFPRFKSADRFDSFCFVQSGFAIRDGKLYLHGIGTLRVRWHRELPEGGKIRSITVNREAGKWFACLAVELPDNPKSPPPASIGIDVGLTAFVSTSDGETLGDSRHLKRSLPELRRAQRALSRCRRGSGRRKIVKRRVTMLHAKVRRSRLDLHHKVARSLVDRYGVIAAERLNVAGLIKNRRLSRRIADAGWGQFIGILGSKAESAGCRVILVDPRNTSQECSACGAIVPKSLSVRVHRCACGCVLDRDVNAARNVLARALPEGRNVDVGRHGPKSQRHLALK